jgi:hypothetical protein
MFCVSIKAGMSARGGGAAKGRSVVAPPSGAGKEGRVGAAVAAAAPAESSFSFLICMPSFSTMMSTAVLALRGDGEERSGGCTVSSLELDEDPEQNTVLWRTSMERLDQGHLHPQLEHPRQTCLDLTGIEAGSPASQACSLAKNYSKKQPMVSAKYLLNTVPTFSYWYPSP